MKNPIQPSLVFKSLVVISSLVATFSPSNELYAFGMKTWGGRVLGTIPCTCTANVTLVMIGPPAPGLFAYIALTQGYREYNFPNASWGLGFYTPGPGTCEMVVGTACSPVNENGVIDTIMGSSF
jgi:hypothetical protein